MSINKNVNLLTAECGGNQSRMILFHQPTMRPESIGEEIILGYVSPSGQRFAVSLNNLHHFDVITGLRKLADEVATVFPPVPTACQMAAACTNEGNGTGQMNVPSEPPASAPRPPIICQNCGKNAAIKDRALCPECRNVDMN